MKKIKIPIVIGMAVLAIAVTGVFPRSSAWAATNNFAGNVSSIIVDRGVGGTPNPVINTFTYSISIPAGVTFSDAGWNTPTIAFNGSESLSDGVYHRDIQIDFTNVTFPDVGDYRFTITETNSSNASLYPVDDRNDNVIIAQVRYRTASNVPDNDNYMITLISEAEGNKIDNGDPLSFYSEASFVPIKINEVVHGNLARTDQCFPYVVKIERDGTIVRENDSFTVSTLSDCAGNPASITENTPTTVYLKHDDTIEILVVTGASYKVARGLDSEDSTQSSYSITMDGSAPNLESGLNTAEGFDTVFASKTATSGEDDPQNNTDIIRTLNSDVVSGIFTNIWVWVALIVLTIISIFFITTKQSSDKKQRLSAE